MKIIAYYRVSTQRQGQSGLGLEAQREAVSAYAAYHKATITAEYTEVESGKKAKRPELEKALHQAQITGGRLVVATLSRLSRDVEFLFALRNAGVDFEALDMQNANTLHVGVMASHAQYERELTSERTKAALKAAKARGVKLGNPNGAAALRRAQKGNADAVEAIKEAADAAAYRLTSTIDSLKAEGHTSLRQIAEQLNARGIKTPRGGKWYATSVKNLLARIDARAP